MYHIQSHIFRSKHIVFDYHILLASIFEHNIIHKILYFFSNWFITYVMCQKYILTDCELNMIHSHSNIKFKIVNLYEKLKYTCIGMIIC